MGKKKEINKEEIAEDWCFHCKDGGSLRVCDYKDCLKAYHPQCVQKEDSFLESEVPWSCNWHSCFICKNAPKFHCFCCPKAVCGHCLHIAEFAVFGLKRGFCHHCLTLAGLVEGTKVPDSDEEKIDFNDRNTYEYLFKSYWEIIRKQEALTSAHVQSAYKLLNKGRNYGYGTEYEDISDFEDEKELVSDYDDLNYSKEHKPMHKRKKNKGKPDLPRRKIKSKKKEFFGWGSKELFKFLESIGKDTSQELSQYDVTDIIAGYCKEQKLFDPEKKKKVLCDEKLYPLLRRKSVNKNGIHKLLTAHFAENIEQSEDEFEYSSEDDEENVLMACKKQRNSSPDTNPRNKEIIPDVRQSYFAAVVAQNIKLVYLRRSLVEELAKHAETFDAKVIGSFVRVKSDPHDYLQKNSHQLLQVTGMKKIYRNGEMDSDVLLQVSNRPAEIPICKLSDDNFSEEECDDLHQRVKNGLLRRPTVVEFEEKARSLHEVITKHWIVRELALLQSRIDQANEKGWRRELSEYMDRKMLLQTPEEQTRLLYEVPEIIADVAEVEPPCKDLSGKSEQEQDSPPESALGGTSNPPRSLKSNGICCWQNDGTDVAEAHESEPLDTEHEKMMKQQIVSMANCTTGLCCCPNDETDVAERHGSEPVDTGHDKMKKQQIGPTVAVIELSDDEEQDATVVESKKKLENLDCAIWHCMSPTGVKRGPLSMSVLKKWSDCFPNELQFKVWKTGQSQEEAIFLADALRLVFSGK